jgi:hypothetical protein
VNDNLYQGIDVVNGWHEHFSILSFPANSIFSIDMPKRLSALPVLIDLTAVDISSIDTVRGGIPSQIYLMV